MEGTWWHFCHLLDHWEDKGPAPVRLVFSQTSPAQLTYDFRIATRSSRQQNNVPASVLSNNGSTGLLSGTDGHEIPLVCVDRLLTQVLL
jgi:hypothetical protein